MAAMVESAMRSAQLAEECGLPHDRIILSAKVSGVQDLVAVYRMLADRSDYPLHLGLTEAGHGNKGRGGEHRRLSILLQEGIGDTIRVSLTPRPGGDRTEEVQIAQQVLQSLGIRSFTPQSRHAPAVAGRPRRSFRRWRSRSRRYLRDRRSAWQAAYPGSEDLRSRVMGCVVNGPGESKHSDIGISRRERPRSRARRCT